MLRRLKTFENRRRPQTKVISDSHRFEPRRCEPQTAAAAARSPFISLERLSDDRDVSTRSQNRRWQLGSYSRQKARNKARFLFAVCDAGWRRSNALVLHDDDDARVLLRVSVCTRPAADERVGSGGCRFLFCVEHAV